MIMNMTKGYKKISRSGSSEAHSMHHCYIRALLSVHAYSSLGTLSDQKQEGNAWFMDGLGQCEGASQKWTVAEL